MRYFQAFSIQPLLTSAMFRWRGPFRHSGITLLAVAMIVVLAILVFQLLREKDEPRNGAPRNESSTK